MHTSLGNLDYSLIVVGGELHKEVVDGVYPHSFILNLVVEMGTERKAGVARQTDNITSLDTLPLLDINARKVAVLCLVACAVVDDNIHTCRCGAGSNLRHLAVGSGKDPGAYGDGKIYALVRGQRLIEWVYELAIRSSEKCEILINDGLNGWNVIGLCAKTIYQLIDILAHNEHVTLVGFELLHSTSKLNLKLCFAHLREPLLIFPTLVGGVIHKVVGLRFEENLEDIPIPFDYIVEHCEHRVVASLQGLVIVLELSIDDSLLPLWRRVEERVEEICDTQGNDKYSQVGEYSQDYAAYPTMAIFAWWIYVVSSTHSATLLAHRLWSWPAR